MSKEMREQINRVKNWKQFLNEGLSKNFIENQKRLREYVKIIKENYELGLVKDDGGNFNKFDICINYFIVIHNFLYLEDEYFDIIKLSNKEINKYLDLPELKTLKDVINKFDELYDTNNNVRFGVETLDSIEEIRLLKTKLPTDFYSKIYNQTKYNHYDFRKYRYIKN